MDIKSYVSTVIGQSVLGLALILLLASPCLAREKRQANGCPSVVVDGKETGLSPKRWVCYTVPESGEIDARMIDLETLLIAERAKRPRHLGFTLQCNAGVGLDVQGDFSALAPACGVYYGFTFSLGGR